MVEDPSHVALAADADVAAFSVVIANLGWIDSAAADSGPAAR